MIINIILASIIFLAVALIIEAVTLLKLWNRLDSLSNDLANLAMKQRDDHECNRQKIDQESAGRRQSDRGLQEGTLDEREILH